MSGHTGFFTFCLIFLQAESQKTGSVMVPDKNFLILNFPQLAYPRTATFCSFFRKIVTLHGSRLIAIKYRNSENKSNWSLWKVWSIKRRFPELLRRSLFSWSFKFATAIGQFPHLAMKFHNFRQITQTCYNIYLK